MKIIRLKECAQFIAGDYSELREILNPRKTKLKLNYSLAYAKVRPGKKTLRHRLEYSEVYFIIKGKGIMHINKEKKLVKAGDTIYIPPNSIQSIENPSKESLEFLCIVNPPWQPHCEEVLEQ
ncbi:MAG: cupin domain-containing protein [bacterium]